MSLPAKCRAKEGEKLASGKETSDNGCFLNDETKTIGGVPMKWRRLGSLVAGLGVLASACTPTDSTRAINAGRSSNSAPLVKATLPANNASGVALQALLTVEFSEPMANDSVSIVVTPQTTLLPFVWTSGDTVLETGPLVSWSANQSHTVVIAGKDVAGNSMNAFSITFTTADASSSCWSNCDPLKSNFCVQGECR